MPAPLQKYFLVVAFLALVICTALFGSWTWALAVALFGGFGALWDLRRQRSSQAQLDHGKESLARDRKRFNAILSATSEGVLVLDEGSQVTFINEAAAELLGLQAADTQAQPMIAALRNPRLVDLASRAVGEAQRCSAEINHGTRILEVFASPIEGPPGVILILHDLTEIRQLESLRTDFVANVSHELKTPLTSIRAYVDTLLEGGLDDPENKRRFVEKIEKHVDSLGVLITDLLSLSRIESGQAISQHARLDIREPLFETVSRMEPNAESKSIHLKPVVSNQPLHVLGDREALQQVFDNLIDNAIKYTESGGSVEIVARAQGSEVRIQIQDTGMGIPPEDLPRVFERFYRVDKARSRELGGTGLGLSIVKHYVQALEGEILVDSTEGVGTTFTLKLPRV